MKLQKKKLISEVQAGSDGFQNSNSQSERVKSNKLSRSRHNKDWKGLVSAEAEPPPIRSSEVDNAHLEENTRSKVSCGPRSLSPKPPVQRKRGRADEQQRAKRDAVLRVNIAASRRLLQVAVRDAVATSRTSNSLVSLTKRLNQVELIDDLESPMHTKTLAVLKRQLIRKKVVKSAKECIKQQGSKMIHLTMLCALQSHLIMLEIMGRSQ